MKEALNEFKIVGKLKSMKLEEKQTKSGKDAIMGYITVEVVEGEKVHNHRVDFFTFKYRLDGKENNIYSSYKTMMNDFKDADTYGNEADYVSVNGSIDYNVYKSQGGVRENMRLRGLFANRISSSADVYQEAFANVEAVITNFTPEMKGDKPTDYTKVTAYTVGYNDRGIKLINLKVPNKFNLQNTVTTGTTLALTLKLNNYSIVKEEKQDDSNSLFGEVKKIVQDKSFVNDLEITGGSYAKFSYEPKEVEAITKSVKEQIAEAEASNGSFGASQSTKQAPDVTDISDKLPF